MQYAQPNHRVGVHLRPTFEESLPVKVEAQHYPGGENTSGEWFSLEIAGVTFFLSRDQIAQIANDVVTVVEAALYESQVAV